MTCYFLFVFYIVILLLTLVECLQLKKENLDYYLVAKKLTIDLSAKETFCVYQHIENDFDVFVFAKVKISLVFEKIK